MPIIWRYLLRAYFRVFFLSISAFIAILLVTRLKEIARFAALGSKVSSIILFTLYQIPHILPIAIPISCLISSILLFQRLSYTHELTALRSSGFGLKVIVAPLLFSATILSIINLYIGSEWTTRSRLRSREMLYEETSENPLILLQRQKLLKVKDFYIDMNSQSKKSAKDFTFITKNSANDRLSLIVAKKMTLKSNMLMGYDVAIMSYLNAELYKQFDTLVLENQSFMSTYATSLSQFMKKNRWKVDTNSLPFRHLLIRLQDENVPKRLYYFSLVEIMRRISLGIAAFTFTFIGAAFGISLGRARSKKGVLWATGMAIFFLTCFLAAKQARYHPTFASIMYLFPHLILFAFGTWSLKRISKGIE